MSELSKFKDHNSVQSYHTEIKFELHLLFVRIKLKNALHFYVSIISEYLKKLKVSLNRPDNIYTFQSFHELFICYLQLVDARANVRHEFNAITWLEASAKCDKKVLEDNENTLLKSDIPIEQEFWIGKVVYGEITPWIEVIGM